MTDQDLIRRTFSLALKGLGTTWPNPLVGAVIVKGGRIIGEGYHRKQGHDHAELDALKNCTESPEGATIYVNLEPCCHTNKTTPPCAQRLITEKIKKVVISNLDPNPSVNGKGVHLLRENGIEVVHDVLNQEGEKLNEVFFLSQRSQRPFVHFKTAATLDGFTAMATGESQWITDVPARKHVHELRSFHQGIIVGGETLRRDNPKLNVRLEGFSGTQPLRIVFTKTGNLPQDCHLFTDELKDRTLVYTQGEISFPFPRSQVVRIQGLKEALGDLFQRKVINLFVEAGPGLATEFFKENLVDRISLYQSPSFLGVGKSMLQNLDLSSLKDRPRLTDVESRWIGGDHYLTGRLICSRD